MIRQNNNIYWTRCIESYCICSLSTTKLVLLWTLLNKWVDKPSIHMTRLGKWNLVTSNSVSNRASPVKWPKKSRERAALQSWSTIIHLTSTSTNIHRIVALWNTCHLYQTKKTFWRTKGLLKLVPVWDISSHSYTDPMPNSENMKHYSYHVHNLKQTLSTNAVRSFQIMLMQNYGISSKSHPSHVKWMKNLGTQFSAFFGMFCALTIYL